MIKIQKLSRVIFLMITSALLLLVFIIRWLQTEYTGEKNILQKELFEQFIAAESRLMDSVISKNFIEPMLLDTAGFEIQTINYTGPHPEGDSINIILEDVKFDTSLIHRNNMRKNLPENARIEFRVEEDSTDIIYSGVKMFISKVRGPEGSHDFFENMITGDDSVMMKTFFAENLSNKKLSVTTNWKQNKTHSKFPPTPFYYESHYFEKPFGVQVTQYNNYILQQILPEGIFSLILFLLIVTSFIFSYRSIKSHIKLATLKDDLISNISHELKTPVATVKVAIESIQAMDPVEKKEKIKDYLGMASEEIERLELLVNKVMNTVLNENGKLVYQKVYHDLNIITQETIQTLQLQNKQTEFNFYSDTENATVLGDALHLKGILFNLAENSIKYAKDKSIITIKISSTPDHIVLTWSDNGPGIPEAYKTKIFEKFFRVPSGNIHNTKGYGLGLFYVAQVMKEHKGSIKVKNNPDTGCTFTLQFPKP